MPSLTFIFEENVKYHWKAENYLFNYTEFSDDKRLTFCIGLSGWNSNEILLGSTWMHNHDIIFDIQHQKIGLVESNCGASNIISVFPDFGKSIKSSNNATNYYNQASEFFSCDTTIEKYVQLILLISTLAILIILLLIYAINKIRRGEKFLWMRLDAEDAGKNN
jgi:hypothetical protein